MKHCVCQSGKDYKKCCGRFLDAGEKARTPEQLMRSRYSAFAQGGYGDYLLATWLPAMSSQLSAAELSIKDKDWFALEILDKSQSGDEAIVEFKAWFRGEKGKEDCQHERSFFRRIKGSWFYVGAELK